MKKLDKATFVEWGDAHLCAISCITTVACSLLAVSKFFYPTALISWNEIAALYLIWVLILPVRYWQKAVSEMQLPARRQDPAENGMPKYRHISGSAAVAITAFLVGITALSLWAISFENHATINAWFGIGCIGLLFALFIWFAFRSYKPGVPKQKGPSNGKLNPLYWISRLFSHLDSILVFPIASSAGMDLAHPVRRFSILLGVLVPPVFLGWLLPTPLSFVPLSWALLVIVAVARRWSWVEDDREIAMLNRKFNDEHLRVGFAQDLRDEALVGFAVLLLMTPVVLRSMFIYSGDALNYDATLNDGALLAEHNYLSWLSLFGTELAKAVPFVDWAEIFEVRGQPLINFDEHASAYQLIIFGMRVVVDLILLAALVQAISIISRTNRQKEMFYSDGTLTRLDPFIEPIELRHLVSGRSKAWTIRDESDFAAFPPYDEDRLTELSVLNPDDTDLPIGEEQSPIVFIAKKLQERDDHRSVEYQLFLQTRKEILNEDRIGQLIESLEAKNELLETDNLLKAHQKLNSRARLIDVRKDIVGLISLQISRNDAKLAVVQIAVKYGDPTPDVRKEVRERAMNALYPLAHQGDQAAQKAIIKMSREDSAPSLREQAAALVRANPEWISQSDSTKEFGPH